MLFSPFFLNLSHFECCWGQHFTLRKWSSFNKKSFHQISKMNKILCGYWKVDACPSHHWTELSVFLKKNTLFVRFNKWSLFLSFSLTHIYSLSLSVCLSHTRLFSLSIICPVFYLHLSLSFIHTYTHTLLYSLSIIHPSIHHTYTHTLFHTYSDFLKNIFIYIHSLSQRCAFFPTHTHNLILFLSLTHTYSLSSASMLASTYIYTYTYLSFLFITHTCEYIYSLSHTYTFSFEQTFFFYAYTNLCFLSQAKTHFLFIPHAYILLSHTHSHT